MISLILLLISIILILIAYLKIILNYLKTKNIKIEDVTGFDIAKELTSNYDEINIVESKEIAISKYNLKRRIIRLTNKDYTSNDINTLTKSSILAGYSLANINKDKNIELLSKIIPSIDYLNKSSIIALIISLLAQKVGDIKITIILLIIILIYQYLLNEINNRSKEQTNKLLPKVITNKKHLSIIEENQNSYLFLNKISFITTLILLLRAVLIIIN